MREKMIIYWLWPGGSSQIRQTCCIVFPFVVLLLQRTGAKVLMARQVSSMIHSARATVSPVATIVFCSFVLLDFESGDGRTDGRTTCGKTMIPTGRDCGLAEWINKWINASMVLLRCYNCLLIINICFVDYDTCHQLK